jgi:hypothetical protein
MQYREIKPSASAARFVKCYWLLEDGLLEDGAPSSSRQRVVPDGRAQLILNLGRPYEVQTERGWQLQPQCFFIGQITAPLVLRASGPFKMIGINFHPHTASQLFKIPICELTDTAAVSLDDFSGQLFRDLNRIKELRSPLEWFPSPACGSNEMANGCANSARKPEQGSATYARSNGRVRQVGPPAPLMQISDPENVRTSKPASRMR